MIRTDRVPEEVSGVRAGHELSQSVTFRLPDCTVRVASNTPRVLDVLGHLYGAAGSPSEAPDLEVTALDTASPDLSCHFVRVPPRPEARVVTTEYWDGQEMRVVRKRHSGMVFAFGADENLAAGPCADHADDLAEFIDGRCRAFLARQGYLSIRAAGATHGTSGVAVAGATRRVRAALIDRISEHGGRALEGERLLVRECAGRHTMVSLADNGSAPVALSGVVVLDADEDAPARVTVVDLTRRPDLVSLLTDEDDLYARAGWSTARPSVSPDALLGVLRGVAAVEATGGADLVDLAAGRCFDALGLVPNG
jgi:hypothetical protein